MDINHLDVDSESYISPRKTIKMRHVNTGINEHDQNAKMLVENVAQIEVFTTGFVKDAKSVEYVKLITATVVSTRNIFSTIGSGVKSIFGGRIKGQIKLMKFNRVKIMQEMQKQAMLTGANAIINLRIDINDRTGFINLFAYGTAVIIKR